MRTRRSSMIIGLLLAGLGLLLHVSVSRTASAPPVEGAVLPDFTLPVSKSATENQYLGVNEEGRFQITQIQSDIVILEIFNMYCPYCQREAPNVNELYSLIAESKDGSPRIKMLGIGAGNSPFEVGTFKKAFNVPFPLFPDSDFNVHARLGQVRTPYFLAIRIDPEGKHEVIYSKVGSIGKPEEFLELLLKQSQTK